MKHCTTTDALRRLRREAAGRSPSSTFSRDCRGAWVVLLAFWFPAVLCCLVFCESVDVAAAGSVQIHFSHPISGYSVQVSLWEESLTDIFVRIFVAGLTDIFIRIFVAVLLAKANPVFLFRFLVFHCPFGEIQIAIPG